mgnify:CR=1 FL=1
MTAPQSGVVALKMADNPAILLFGAGREKRIYAVPPYTTVESLDFDDHPFRPMRAPMPVIGLRYMIEQDAVFAAKHKLLTAPYLLRFGAAGARRLAHHWRRDVETRAKA